MKKTLEQTLEQRAFEILRNDMSNNGISDEEIWRQVKMADEETLAAFVEEMEE